MNYQTTRYTYDRLGNRTSKRDVLAEQAGADLDEIYTYDQQNQLIDLDRVGNHEHFHYDTTGNWLAYQRNGTLQARTHNTANEIVSLDGSDTSLRTDAAGNMTRIPNPKAVPGQTVAQNLNLTYDAWNRLIRVSTPDGSEVMSCSYDGLNRRVRKTTASETREYYYNKNWQCLEEYLYGTLQNSYLWGLRYLDDLICFTPDYTIALTDANFNVVAVANQSGLTERYTYTAFGQRTILTPSYAPRSESMYPALTRTFTSQVLDHETGVMLYRNRYYNSKFGRFISRDYIEINPFSSDYYKYAHNNTLLFLDTFGLDPDCNTACNQLLNQAIKELALDDCAKVFQCLSNCQVSLKDKQDNIRLLDFDAIAYKYQANGITYNGICISEKFANKCQGQDGQRYFNALLMHEFTHFKKHYGGNCNNPPNLPQFFNDNFICTTCQRCEKEAYKVQFNILYPNGTGFKVDQKLFEQIGVYLSCKHACPKLQLPKINENLIRNVRLLFWLRWFGNNSDENQNGDESE